MDDNERLNKRFSRQRLGADWCVATWQATDDVFICDAEIVCGDCGNLYELVRRTADDDGVYVDEGLATGSLDHVLAELEKLDA